MWLDMCLCLKVLSEPFMTVCESYKLRNWKAGEKTISWFWQLSLDLWPPEAANTNCISEAMRYKFPFSWAAGQMKDFPLLSSTEQRRHSLRANSNTKSHQRFKECFTSMIPVNANNDIVFLTSGSRFGFLSLEMWHVYCVPNVLI